jgi:ABC-type multidrug transport system ATPase subunit
MEVKLENVSYYDHEVLSGDWINSPHKINKHLDNCSLTLSSGTLIGIIGSPSETLYLLKLISLKYLNSGQILGSLRHDHSIRKNSSCCYRDIAFIPHQFNCQYFHYLTVSHYLYWSAQLRLPYTTTVSECSHRAREVCHLVELNSSLFIHELEHGQLFLLSLATELLTSPTLICIESPIDDEEEYSALLIIQTLAKIAHRFNTSTTIVFTALSPSSSVFSQLDQIVVFLNKRILYSSRTFFEKHDPHQHQQRSLPSSQISGSTSGGNGSGNNLSRSSFLPSSISTPLTSPPSPLHGELDSSAAVATIESSLISTSQFCYEAFELISREFKRSGYGTKLFYLSPDLLRLIAKEVDLLHLLVAHPTRSNHLLERYLERQYPREMREKRERLEGVVQRYIQMVVTRCLEHHSVLRKVGAQVQNENHQERSPPHLWPPANLSFLSVLSALDDAPQSPRSSSRPQPTSPGFPNKASTPSRQRRLPPAMVVKSSNPFLTEVKILTLRAWASATTNV